MPFIWSKLKLFSSFLQIFISFLEFVLRSIEKSLVFVIRMSSQPLREVQKLTEPKRKASARIQEQKNAVDLPEDYSFLVFFPCDRKFDMILASNNRWPGYLTNTDKLNFADKRPYPRVDFKSEKKNVTVTGVLLSQGAMLLMERLARKMDSLVDKGKEHIDDMDITINFQTACKELERDGFFEELENMPPSKRLRLEKFKMPLNVEVPEAVEVDNAADVNDDNNADLPELEGEEVNRLMEAINGVKTADEASGVDKEVNSFKIMFYEQTDSSLFSKIMHVFFSLGGRS